MGAVVLAHVYQFGCLLHHSVSGFAHLLGLTDKGDDCAVGGGTRIDVEQLYAFDFLYLCSHLVDDIHVASLADVGYAFNKLFHGKFIVVMMNCLLFYNMIIELIRTLTTNY